MQEGSLSDILGTEEYTFLGREGRGGNKRLTLKWGTGTFTDDLRPYRLSPEKIRWAAKVMYDLKRKHKKEVVGVISGAVVMGMARRGINERPRKVAQRQYTAAIGQADFMELFQNAFDSYGMVAAQGLLTRQNFATPEELSNLLAGADIGTKFLPDVWGKEPHLRDIGKSACVTSAFIENTKNANADSVNKRMDRLTIDDYIKQGRGRLGAFVEAQYRIKPLPDSPDSVFYRLTLTSLRKT